MVMAIFFWSMVMVVRGPPFTYFGHGNWQLLHHTTAMSPFCPVVTCLQPTVRRPLRATTYNQLPFHLFCQPPASTTTSITTTTLRVTSQRIILSYPIYSYTGFFYSLSLNFIWKSDWDFWRLGGYPLHVQFLQIGYRSSPLGRSAARIEPVTI